MNMIRATLYRKVKSISELTCRHDRFYDEIKIICDILSNVEKNDEICKP
jgi:hypothetical protein